MKRLATALVLTPLIVWVVLGAPQWAFLGVLAIIGGLAFYEYDRIAAEHGFLRAGIPGLVAGLALLLAPSPWVVATLAGVAAMTWSLRATDLAKSLPSAAAFLLGIVYIFGSWRTAVDLREISRHWLMFALLINWAGDTAAYYVGRNFGKHKLAPRVSPAKTWEGAAGSVVGALVSGGVYAHYLLPETLVIVVLALATAGNVAGQIGDLCESAFKRGAGVKDSGTLLPGHGGWLDRIDSSLFSVPVVYALVRLVTK